MLELFLAAVISSCSFAVPPCSQSCFVPPQDPTVLRCVKEFKDRGEVVRCVAPDLQSGVCAP